MARQLSAVPSGGIRRCRNRRQLHGSERTNRFPKGSHRPRAISSARVGPATGTCLASHGRTTKAFRTRVHHGRRYNPHCPNVSHEDRCPSRSRGPSPTNNCQTSSSRSRGTITEGPRMRAVRPWQCRGRHLSDSRETRFDIVRKTDRGELLDCRFCQRPATSLYAQQQPHTGSRSDLQTASLVSGFCDPIQGTSIPVTVGATGASGRNFRLPPDGDGHGHRYGPPHGGARFRRLRRVFHKPTSGPRTSVCPDSKRSPDRRIGSVITTRCAAARTCSCEQRRRLCKFSVQRCRAPATSSTANRLQRPGGTPIIVTAGAAITNVKLQRCRRASGGIGKVTKRSGGAPR